MKECPWTNSLIEQKNHRCSSAVKQTMATRFKDSNSVSLPLLQDESRGIMYSCRMQYLRSREGGNRNARRRGSMDIQGVGCDEDRPQFSCLDERVHGPCSSEILLPPNELMTRTKAFRFAYWKYHREPTMRAIKKLEFGQDERNERLRKKRKEILTRMEATLKAKRESELRRRAERVMNHTLESMEEDSADESDSDSVNQKNNSEPLGRRTFPYLAQDDESRGGSITSPISSRRKTRPSILGSSTKPSRSTRPDEPNDAILPPLGGRRVSVNKRGNDSRGKENTEDSAFSFFSDWGKRDKQTIRW
ncbi:hypothetical protein HJC23_006541 [Cyclotella cryptica]|uniref:Uncharacterized protein n=1 Tax=Cyclotella cryptica TaxID=29204 RepID=A0ABD3PKF6_9STRA|eukprot:CCRYP_013623-RB/>CCRYP_013623-RB protein AED:0.27 eAED:0.27 QI:569/1/1/1/0/0/3/104/304